jgi:hypothetical protein
MTTISVMALTGCATVPESTRGTLDLKTQADIAVARAQRNDPSLAAALQNAAGHAVFPAIGPDARAGGATYDKGVLYEYGDVVGEVGIRQSSSGSRQDGEAYTEIIVFQTEEAVFAFKHDGVAFDALATAVAIKSGAAANATYSDGVAVFTLDHSGEPYAASVGGQKFSYHAQWPTGESPSIALAGAFDP